MKVSRVLITGANGFVGMSLCDALLKRGLKIRRAVRRAGRAGGEGVEDKSPSIESIIIGDITQQTDWSRALTDVDVVIHLAARVHVMQDSAADPLSEFRRINTVGTEQLARSAAAGGVKRLVYVSSIKVNGESTRAKAKFSETDTPAPEDPYGVSKWEAEVALRGVAAETGLEVVIVRPPLVYGPGVKGNFAQMLRVIENGLPLPLALVHNQRSFIYVGNLADALATCAIHPCAAGQMYLVSDGEDISTAELLRRLAAGMDRPARLWPFPPSLLRVLAAIFGKGAQANRLLGSLQVDSGKIRRELNWVPPYSLQQGLRATAEWYRTNDR